MQLEQIAAGYQSRERFLTELTLDPPDATSDQAGVTAARRGLSDPVDHSIRPKGQEWRSVFMLNVVDGCIPSRNLATGTSTSWKRSGDFSMSAYARQGQFDADGPQRFFTGGQHAQVTAMSTRAAHALSPRHCFSSSRAQPGPSPAPMPPSAAQSRSASMSRPGCAPCGSRVQQCVMVIALAVLWRRFAGVPSREIRKCSTDAPNSRDALSCTPLLPTVGLGNGTLGRDRQTETPNPYECPAMVVVPASPSRVGAFERRSYCGKHRAEVDSAGLCWSACFPPHSSS